MGSWQKQKQPKVPCVRGYRESQGAWQPPDMGGKRSLGAGAESSSPAPGGCRAGPGDQHLSILQQQPSRTSTFPCSAEAFVIFKGEKSPTNEAAKPRP